jgi:hypothetical protein
MNLNVTDMSKDVLYIEKAKLIESIVEIKDIIKKLRLLVTKSAKLPAVMTVDELKIEVMQSYEDAKNGKGKSMEQLFKEAEQW